MAAPVRLSGGQGITGRFYALDWGLKCDSQTPDHIAWNELIAYIKTLGTGGAQIDLPPFSTVILAGQVNLITNLTINIPVSTTVKGDGVFTGALFSGSSLSGVQIIGGGTIDANNAAVNCINLTSCTNASVTGLTLKNATQRNLSATSCDYLSVEYNDFVGGGATNHAVLYSDSGSNHIRIAHNNFSGMSGNGGVIKITTNSANCEAPVIDDNTIDWSGVATTSSTTGIELYGTTAAACPHASITNNRIYAPASGTPIAISANCQNGVIDNNRLYNIGGYGIEVGAPSTIVSNNQVIGCTQGIVVDGTLSPNDVQIHHNQIISSSSSALSLQAGTNHLIDSNVIIDGTSSGDANKRWLSMAAMTSVTITNNKFFVKDQDVTGGIAIYGNVPNAVITGNTVGPDTSGTATHGVQALNLGGANVMIANNTFNGADPTGAGTKAAYGWLSGASSTGCLVAHNQITNYATAFYDGPTNGGNSNFFVGNTTDATSVITLSSADYMTGFSGGLPTQRVTATSAATYAVAAGDSTIASTTGASNAVINLPAATGSGRWLWIVKADSGAGSVVITPNGTDKINTATTVSLTSQNQNALLIDQATGEWNQLQLSGSLTGLTLTNPTINGSLQATGTAPTITVSASAGTGATVTSQTKWVTATDLRGRLDLVTGTGTSAGQVISIVTNQTFSAYPVPLVTPGDAATAALEPYADANGDNSVRIFFANAPAASTTYTLNYAVIG